MWHHELEAEGDKINYIHHETITIKLNQISYVLIYVLAIPTAVASKIYIIRIHS